ASRLDRLRLLPILQELLEADVRERMIVERIDYRRRTRRDVGAHARGFDDVHRVAAACDEHFGLEVVVVVDCHDLANQLHAVRRDVVEPPDEGADEGGSHFRGDGFVVTPWRRPRSARVWMSLMLPVSTKSFIWPAFFLPCAGAHPQRLSPLAWIARGGDSRRLSAQSTIMSFVLDRVLQLAHPV